jgi:hypothetical protein
MFRQWLEEHKKDTQEGGEYDKNKSMDKNKRSRFNQKSGCKPNYKSNPQSGASIELN